MIAALFVKKNGLYYNLDGIDPWVANNVYPVIGVLTPQEPEGFKQALQDYLQNFEEITLIADWPEDIKHFCEQLITGPGTMLQTIPVITMQINRNLNSGKSAIPHNALEDARAIMKAAQ